MRNVSARAGLGGRHTHPNRNRLAVTRQRDGLRAHDAPTVLDDELHLVAGVARCATMTSTTSDAPLSTLRGASTRLTSMSS
jgi:hypothetical protein